MGYVGVNYIQTANEVNDMCVRTFVPSSYAALQNSVK